MTPSLWAEQLAGRRVLDVTTRPAPSDAWLGLTADTVILESIQLDDGSMLSFVFGGVLATFIPPPSPSRKAD